MDDLDARRMMLEVATTYDRLAGNAEKRAAANRHRGAVTLRVSPREPAPDTPKEP
jgi:hypothetical protein